MPSLVSLQGTTRRPQQHVSLVAQHTRNARANDEYVERIDIPAVVGFWVGIWVSHGDSKEGQTMVGQTEMEVRAVYTKHGMPSCWWEIVKT